MSNPYFTAVNGCIDPLCTTPYRVIRLSFIPVVGEELSQQSGQFFFSLHLPSVPVNRFLHAPYRYCSSEKFVYPCPRGVCTIIFGIINIINIISYTRYSTRLLFLVEFYPIHARHVYVSETTIPPSGRGLIKWISVSDKWGGTIETLTWRRFRADFDVFGSESNAQGVFNYNYVIVSH